MSIISKIWSDAVWSKVIGGIIVGIIGYLVAFIIKRLGRVKISKPAYKLLREMKKDPARGLTIEEQGVFSQRVIVTNGKPFEIEANGSEREIMIEGIIGELEKNGLIAVKNEDKNSYKMTGVGLKQVRKRRGLGA
jgi:hypothetical protein